MERVKGIEPSSQAWEARILPLDHTRFQRTTKGLADVPRRCNLEVGARDLHVTGRQKDGLHHRGTEAQRPEKKGCGMEEVKRCF